MVPEFYLFCPRKRFTAGQFYIASAAGQAPFWHCPSATFHAQSVFGILAETAQEGAICAGYLIPPVAPLSDDDLSGSYG